MQYWKVYHNLNDLQNNYLCLMKHFHVTITKKKTRINWHYFLSHRQQDALKWGVIFQNGSAHLTHILSTVTEFCMFLRRDK